MSALFFYLPSIVAFLFDFAECSWACLNSWHFVAQLEVANYFQQWAQLPQTQEDWVASCPKETMEAVQKAVGTPPPDSGWALGVVLADGTYIYCSDVGDFSAHSAVADNTNKKRTLLKGNPPPPSLFCLLASTLFHEI